MMNRLVTMFAAGCALLSGCAGPFLHPVATEETRVADPGIVGAWQSKDDDSELFAMIVPGTKPAPASPYALTLTMRDDKQEQTWKIDLSLTDIGTARYADLFLAQKECDALAERYGFLVLPVHQVLKLERDGDTLRVYSLLPERLRLEAEDAGPPLPSEQVRTDKGEMTVVTASTATARKVLAARGADSRYFTDPIVFHRVEPKEEKRP